MKNLVQTDAGQQKDKIKKGQIIFTIESETDGHTKADIICKYIIGVRNGCFRKSN